MNGQMQDKVIHTGLIIFAILFALCFFRAIAIAPDITNDGICRLEHGANWVYENDDIFGGLCMELDYDSLDVVDRIKLNITLEEATKKYCDRAGFLELSRWDDGCVK